MPDGPATPKQALGLKNSAIPRDVFDVFNSLIAKDFNGKYATVRQDEVVKILTSDKYCYTSDQLFGNHWLDVEQAYADRGWTVKYDKPAYCETYPATWEFTAKP
jgi:hypothetical protein